MIGTSVDPTTAVDQAVKSRVLRALELQPEVTQHGDLYVVAGRTRNYTVSLDHQTYGECCPCRDHELQRERQSGIRCYHIIATTQAIATGRVA